MKGTDQIEVIFSGYTESCVYPCASLVDAVAWAKQVTASGGLPVYVRTPMGTLIRIQDGRIRKGRNPLPLSLFREFIIAIAILVSLVAVFHVLVALFPDSSTYPNKQRDSPANGVPIGLVGLAMLPPIGGAERKEKNGNSLRVRFLPLLLPTEVLDQYITLEVNPFDEIKGRALRDHIMDYVSTSPAVNEAIIGMVNNLILKQSGPPTVETALKIGFASALQVALVIAGDMEAKAREEYVKPFECLGEMPVRAKARKELFPDE